MRILPVGAVHQQGHHQEPRVTTAFRTQKGSWNRAFFSRLQAFIEEDLPVICERLGFEDSDFTPPRNAEEQAFR